MRLERRLTLRLRYNCCTPGDVGKCLYEKRFDDGTVHRYVLDLDCIRAVFGGVV